MKRNYKEYLFQKLILDDLKIPTNYRFASVMKLLDQIDENIKDEDWKETSLRLKYKMPKVSEYLIEAYNKI